jgi:predicted RNase H-like nuclease (RuvC/YqgF family)
MALDLTDADTKAEVDKLVEEAVKGLKETNQNLKTEKGELAKTLEGMQAQLDEISKEKDKATNEKLRKEGDVDQLIANAKKELQDQLDAKNKIIDDFENNKKKSTVKEQVTAALKDAKANVDAMLPHVMGRVEPVVVDGSVMLKVLNDDGTSMLVSRYLSQI